MGSFTPHTEEHIRQLPVAARKKMGQYMTPQPVADRMASMFTFLPNKTYTVLDPAAGTGELLLAVTRSTAGTDTEVALEAWDADKGMLGTCQKNNPESVTTHRSLYDPLPPELHNRYDKIIGNPPYFQVPRNSPQLKNLQLETLNGSGRINIYALFIEYSLKTLKLGGELVFLIPPSMNNGAYFDHLRTHILKHAYIKHLEILRDNTLFADALTSTQILHLIKTDHGYEKNLNLSSRYVFDFATVNQSNGAPLIFTEDSDKLKQLWRNKKSLHDLGYTVRTGSVEWNRHKNDFTNTGTPLLHSKDITRNNTLHLNPALADRRHLPPELKNPETRPSIITNRVVGSLTSPQLKHCLVTLPEYLTENHTNQITVTNLSDRETELEQLKQLTKRLHRANQSLPEYLKLITGNTQLSSRELKYMIPL